MLDKRFDDSGRKVIIEKKLSGTGSLLYCICDGNTFVPFAIVRITNEYMTMIRAPIPGVWDPIPQ